MALREMMKHMGGPSRCPRFGGAGEPRASRLGVRHARAPRHRSDGGRPRELRTGDDLPLLLPGLAASGGPDGTLVTIDAIACNPKATAIIEAGATIYWPCLRARSTVSPEPSSASKRSTRAMAASRNAASRVSMEAAWLAGDRVLGEYRLPCIAAVEEASYM